MALVAFLPPDKVDIPHEPGNWIGFKRPRNQDVENARKIRASEGRGAVRQLGAEIYEVILGGKKSQEEGEAAIARAEAFAKAHAFDLDQFDRMTLLVGGVKEWGGPNYREPETDKAVTVTPDRIADLDEETAAWAYEHIVGLIRPVTKEAEKSAPAAAAQSA